MTYSFTVKISATPRKRKPLPYVSLIGIIKSRTHLTHTEITRLAKLVANGEEIEIRPKEAGDADSAFEFSHAVAQLGFQTSVDCTVLSNDLPYLVNSKGRVNGSEKAREQELDHESLENLLAYPNVPMVVTGFGYGMRWIHGNERYKFWKEIKSQLIDSGNSSRRNDYPLYYPSHWMSEAGESFIFLWTLH